MVQERESLRILRSLMSQWRKRSQRKKERKVAGSLKIVMKTLHKKISLKIHVTRHQTPMKILIQNSSQFTAESLDQTSSTIQRMMMRIQDLIMTALLRHKIVILRTVIQKMMILRKWTKTGLITMSQQIKIQKA